MQEVWLRLGRLPGWLVVGTLLGAVWLTRVAIGQAPGSLVVSLLAVLVAYCLARDREGLNVFLYAAAPGAVGALVHDIFGVSRYWGALLIPFALYWIWEIDRNLSNEDGHEAPDRPPGGSAASEPGRAG